jgi:hypothetical protein
MSPFYYIFLVEPIINLQPPMKKLIIISIGFALCALQSSGQKLPTGNPADFRVKTCLHSVSYMGIWRGQATLTVDEFLLKAKELGFEGIMLAAKTSCFAD